MMNISMPVAAVAATPGPPSDLKYRPDIDGLRALAIIPVVVFHAFPQLLRGGFVGVDVFFVISGYLITSIVARELDQGRFSLGQFYARRVRRIFPALIAVLLTTMIAGWFLLLDGEFHQFMWHIFSGFTFWQNIALLREAGYFNAASEMKPLLHLWSLAVEEQFYIVLPLVLLAVTRLRGRRAFLLVLGLWMVSFALGVSTVERSPEKAFYMPHLRAWELLTGSMVALSAQYLRDQNLNRWRVSNLRLPAWTSDVVSAVGLFVLALSVISIDKSDDFPGWFALPPVLGAVAIIVAGPAAWINRMVLGSRVLVFVGLLSFPLYLWHWPVLVYLRMAVGGLPPAAFQLAGVCVSIALAWATYRLIELPVRTGATKIGSNLIALLLVGFATVMSLIGVAGAYGSLDAMRPASLRENSANFSWAGMIENRNCRSRFPELKAKFCNLAEDREPTVALIGDSHALVYYPGLAPALAARGENLLNVGGPSCMPVFSAPFHSTGYPLNPIIRCPEAMDPTYDLIQRTPSIHTVILSARRFLRTLTPVEVENGWRALDASVRRLEAAGKAVIYVLDFPEMPIEPSTCARPYVLVDKDSACRTAKSDAADARRSQENMIRRLAESHPELIVHDPFVDLCEGFDCPIMSGRNSLYRDRDHLSLDGSILAARSLTPLVLQMRR